MATVGSTCSFGFMKPCFGFMTPRQEKITIFALAALGLGLVAGGLYYSPQNIVVGECLKSAGYSVEALAAVFILRKALASCLSCLFSNTQKTPNTKKQNAREKPKSDFELVTNLLLNAANFNVPDSGELATCSIDNPQLLQHVEALMSTTNQYVYKGQFLEASHWILIRFKQKVGNDWVDNYLLFIEQNNQPLRIENKRGAPKILFNSQSDVEWLMDILANGKGILRKDASSTWEIDMGYKHS